MASVRNPNADSENKAGEIFLNSYRLLSRWQYYLEFFLFKFCQINAPKIIAKSHWPCYQAAELSDLSTKISSYYHNEKNFKKSGMSEKDRSLFCAELEAIRQVRNKAVHRKVVSELDLKHYADCALSVLKSLRQLGGRDFEEAHGKSLDRLVDSFWDADTDRQGIVSTLGISHAENGQDMPGSVSAEERRRKNFELAMKTHESAEQRRNINMANMREEMQLAQHKRAIKQQRDLEQKEAASRNKMEKKMERQLRVAEQEKMAEHKKNERALRAKLQEEAAARSKMERELRVAEQEEMAARKRNERALRMKLQEEAAAKKKMEREHRAQVPEETATRRTNVKVLRIILQEGVEPRKSERSRNKTNLQTMDT